MPDMQPIGGLSRWSGWLSAFAMVCRCRRQRPVPAWNLFSTAALNLFWILWLLFWRKSARFLRP